MTIVTIHINVSGLKRKSEAFQTLRVFTHEDYFQVEEKKVTLVFYLWPRSRVMAISSFEADTICTNYSGV